MSLRRFERILHPSDFSTGARGAFAHALVIAAAARAELNILHIDDSSARVEWTDFPSVRDTLARWGRLDPAASIEDLEALGISVKKTRRHGSSPSAAVACYVKEHPSDLIVLATRQRKGIARFSPKAIAAPLARQTRIATLFVPRESTGFVDSGTGLVRLKNILIPVRGGPRAQRIADLAFSLAGSLDASELRATLLHVGSASDLPDIRVNACEGWAVEPLARPGNVVDEIQAAARSLRPDLIVMGARNPRGIVDSLLGTISERIVSCAECPILALPA